MSLPNFFIIGAAKAGTTGLYHTLKQHPQIFMSPIKEPRYFGMGGRSNDFRGQGDSSLTAGMTTRFEDYQLLFDGIGDQPAIGEASTWYLMQSETAAPGIRRCIPNARLIAILRQPAERAYSHYLMYVSLGHERRSFRDALQAEPERTRMHWAPGWRYKANGFYHHLLQPYTLAFPRQQMRFYLYEDWKTNPTWMLRDIFDYLGVSKIDLHVLKKNVTWHPRSTLLQHILASKNPLKLWLKQNMPASLRHRLSAALWRLNKGTPPRIDPAIHRKLTAEYREDILNVQDLIGRDLTHWLS